MVPAKQLTVDTRPDPMVWKSRAATTKAATRLRVARRRSGPQELPRVESPSRLFGDVRCADTVAPRGCQVELRCGIRVAPNRSHKCPPCGDPRVAATERAVVINYRILGPVAKVAPHVASDNLSSLQASGPRAG